MTISEETAKGFKAIVEGFKAMGQLRYGDLPAVKGVLGGLKCETKGTSFTATFSVSAGDVKSAVKAVTEQNKARPQGKKYHRHHESSGTEEE